MFNHRGFLYITGLYNDTLSSMYISEKEGKSRNDQICRLCSQSAQTCYYAIRFKTAPTDCLSGCDREENGIKSPTLTQHSPLWAVSGSRPRRTGTGCSDPARSHSIFPCFSLFSLFVRWLKTRRIKAGVLNADSQLYQRNRQKPSVVLDSRPTATCYTCPVSSQSEQ